MKFTELEVPGVILCQPTVFQDERGFFLESYKKKIFAEAGISQDFVQDNHSRSKQGVLRGLHYQIYNPQGKLVRVIFGEIFDVAVDLRRPSPTFGKWVGARLSAENRNMLWIPPGFAHGFFTMSDWADILYKATDYYAPEWERSIIWDDPDIGIDWPLNDITPILSKKDAAGVLFSQAEAYQD
ncbi:MAG TPA: dTDP-4-dehydrorhamnose 3,5-epimerase [Anaerolineales bacterium]|nr:dTDP-4-dehydrorhamnose 3,5-epimerase [Anaerolineales bacterium]HNB35037.1 dTDP-4-dehydrorhamnose 3,5-epimerase [Anaerolineales bacterium]HNC07747.1 dTDP-4-dehydrorhamnose 3,5-epimerase [Anaerolineales bacterium]